MTRYLIPDACIRDIGEYEKTGGYQGLEKALSMEPGQVVEEVKKSGLRGRGGAGFPTGMKWMFAAGDPKFPKYIVCNADEGEPGTFKDKALLKNNPHILIEGMAIAAHALKAETGYVYLRAEYPKEKEILEAALAQAHEKGFLGENIMGSGARLDIQVHRGAGAYICGEETALIDSLEGKRGQPRLKPPFPVNAGLWGKPTVVNNVETFANLPFIMRAGAQEYMKIGAPDCPGNKLFSVSGHVEKPGVYELPMGITLKDIIYDHAGGIKNGKALKAVIPGGVSAPVLPPDKIDCPMDFVSVQKWGSMLGSGGVIVFDEDTCMVQVAHRALQFFEHESCGKCTPCREGTGWLRAILERLETRQGREGDIRLLEDVSRNIAGNTFCPLGDGAAMVVLGFLKHFKEEFSEHIENGCPYGRTGKRPDRPAPVQ